MQVGDVVDGRFELLDWMGAGGMGEVFRARDHHDAEIVALKVLHRPGPAAWTRISREAQLLSMMKVPGVVRYIEHGVTDAGAPYMAMQWIDGESLEERLSRGPLSLEDSFLLIQRLAHALGGVHALGLVHRDLKPANIMLPEGDLSRGMLIDFGVALDALPARVAEQASAKSGGIAGTPAYMAPEQVQGMADIDARADVFALGCVLYECLTGRPAFSAGDLLTLLARVVLEDPPSLKESCPGISTQMEELCRRMLAKRREERPRDGDEVAQWLDGLADETSAGFAGAGHAVNRLSSGERQQIALILVQARLPGPGDTLQITLGEAENQEQIQRLRIDMEALGVKSALVQPEWMLAVLFGEASTGELSVRAFRCALLLRERFARAAIYVASGRAEVAGRLPVGALIDIITDMTREHKRPPSPKAVRVDELSVGLEGGRFSIMTHNEALWLMGEIEDRGTPAEYHPTLLGRTLPCFGRDREIDALENAILPCLSGQRGAGAALITGGVGIGKSRLWYEVSRRIALDVEKAGRWTARGDPMRAGSPFGLISQALRRLMGIREGESKTEQLRKVEERVALHPGLLAKRVAIFLGEMLGLPSKQDDIQLKAARHSSVLMGDRIREAWEEFVRAECSAHPVLFVLEDMHWGDWPTVNLIGAALRYVKDLPFFVVAIARPEVHALFPDLWKEHQPFQLLLSPLNLEASEALCLGALGNACHPELLTRVIELADGNPFFLEEQIRGVAAGQAARLPETVLSTVQARLDTYSAASRQILRAASIFGETFWRGGVEHLLGEAKIDVQEELGALIELEVLIRPETEQLQGQEEYRFRHSLLREAAYGLLTERDRRIGHALAGSWLEEVGGMDSCVLAEHFRMGGMPSKSCLLWRKAAEEALRGNDFQGALERAEHGVACGPDGKVLGALRRIQAEAHIWKAEYALAEERGIEAMERLEAQSAPWYEAAVPILWAIERRGDVQQLNVLAERVSNKPMNMGAWTAWKMVLADVSAALAMHGQKTQSEELLQLLDHSDESGDQPAEILARRHQAEATVLSFGGQLGLAMDKTEASLEAFERAGDLRHACAARTALGSLLTEAGDYAQALAQLRIAHKAAARLSLKDLQFGTLLNLGMALGFLGHYEEAIQMEENALSAFRQMKGFRIECAGVIYLGRIYLLQGDYVQAERCMQRAFKLRHATPTLYPFALAVHAAALLMLGRGFEALCEARDAFRLMEEQGGVEEGEAFIRLIYGETLMQQGESGTALAILGTARDKILIRAQTLQDPRRRQQFLHAVPEHARTLALAAQQISSDKAL